MLNCAFIFILLREKFLFHGKQPLWQRKSSPQSACCVFPRWLRGVFTRAIRTFSPRMARCPLGACAAIPCPALLQRSTDFASCELPGNAAHAVKKVLPAKSGIVRLKNFAPNFLAAAFPALDVPASQRGQMVFQPTVKSGWRAWVFLGGAEWRKSFAAEVQKSWKDFIDRACVIGDSPATSSTERPLVPTTLPSKNTAHKYEILPKYETLHSLR